MPESHVGTNTNTSCWPPKWQLTVKTTPSGSTHPWKKTSPQPEINKTPRHTLGLPSSFCGSSLFISTNPTNGAIGCWSYPWERSLPLKDKAGSKAQKKMSDNHSHQRSRATTGLFVTKNPQTPQPPDTMKDDMSHIPNLPPIGKMIAQTLRTVIYLYSSHTVQEIDSYWWLCP